MATKNNNKQPQPSAADITLNNLLQIQVMLGCTTLDALEIYRELKYESTQGNQV